MHSSIYSFLMVSLSNSFRRSGLWNFTSGIWEDISHFNVFLMRWGLVALVHFRMLTSTVSSSAIVGSCPCFKIFFVKSKTLPLLLFQHCINRLNYYYYLPLFTAHLLHYVPSSFCDMSIRKFLEDDTLLVRIGQTWRIAILIINIAGHNCGKPSSLSVFFRLKCGPIYKFWLATNYI